VHSSCLRVLVLVLLRIHDISPHRQFQSALDVVARVEEATVLEQENTATFGDHVYALLHIPGVERGCTAAEWLLAILALRVVQIQV
jgi:hypothetical protein